MLVALAEAPVETGGLVIRAFGEALPEGFGGLLEVALLKSLDAVVETLVIGELLGGQLGFFAGELVDGDADGFSDNANPSQ